MKKLSKVLLLALATSMTLSACSKPNKSGKDGEKPAQKETVKEGVVADKFVVENKGTAVKDATLRVAYIADAPFTGIFHQAFASGNPDMSILQYSTNGTFNNDEDYKLTNGGGADVEFKPEENKAIIKIHPKYTWNDGVPVTAKDFVRYYLIIADKEYDGVRFDDDMRNVVGIEEYNKGEAKEISGLKIVDDKTLEITFKEFGPTILWGGGIPSEPVPDHVYKDIPVKEQAAHEKTTKTPLSPGPYFIKEVVPGQQVVLEANPHWFKGEAKVKTVIWKVVPSSQIVAALQSGDVDLTVGLNANVYDKVKELKNIQLTVRDDLAYTYIGFKLGKWDAEKGEVVTDVENAKMGDPALRKAIGYAVDNDTVGLKFYKGLRRNATQLIIPTFKNFYDDSLKGFEYSEEKAKKILDDAGYKDVDGDGLREDKKGQKLVIKFASMAGGVGEEITQYQLQQWKKIGLDVQLSGGRLMDFNDFYERLEKDDPEIDMYQGAWGTGSNPNPAGLYGPKSLFNYSRFQTPELTAILNKIGSKDALDKTKRDAAYKEFSNYMFEHAPVIPTLFRKGITAVNNRVSKWDVTTGTTWGLGDVELLADQPIK